jgi:hypothetical protein
MPSSVRSLARAAFPPSFLGAIDYHVRRRGILARTPPLNGQAQRIRIVDELFASIGFECVVETGTFRGSSAEWFAARYARPVLTCELHPRYLAFSRRRLGGLPGVRVVAADSRAFLRSLAADPAFAHRRVLFYLDAHWGHDLPLAEELDTVFGRWSDALVLVDDFAVPGDPGYGFDDYGPGKRLDFELLRPLAGRGIGAFAPVAPSTAETGTRRGCVVLGASPLVPALGALRTLRRMTLPEAARPGDR